jgi:hypothetical protein
MISSQAMSHRVGKPKANQEYRVNDRSFLFSEGQCCLLALSRFSQRAIEGRILELVR